ncbi:MAG: hypothetical protein WC379_10390 [Methanoregula sp.]|jgi:hypothetical protein
MMMSMIGKEFQDCRGGVPLDAKNKHFTGDGRLAPAIGITLDGCTGCPVFPSGKFRPGVKTGLVPVNYKNEALHIRCFRLDLDRERMPVERVKAEVGVSIHGRIDPVILFTRGIGESIDRRYMPVDEFDVTDRNVGIGPERQVEICQCRSFLNGKTPEVHDIDANLHDLQGGDINLRRRTRSRTGKGRAPARAGHHGKLNRVMRTSS